MFWTQVSGTLPELTTGGEQVRRQYSILTMPDIFLDHYLLAGSSSTFFNSLARTASRGSRTRIRQRIALGGNAYLFGLHAAKLGCSVTFLSRTSAQLLEMVKKETEGLDFSTRYVRTVDDPSLTVALEFSEGKRSSTVNINHPGALERFGKADFPAALSKRRFDVVSVFNFTNNSLGTQLAEHVFRSCRGVKLMDLPDPASGFSDWTGLKAAIGLSNVISCNPVEVRHAASSLGLVSGSSVRDSASALSKLGPVVGVHSGRLCMEAVEGDVATFRVKEVSIPSTTGAGDIWTAAYILSILRGKKRDERLRFASNYATKILLARSGK